MLGMMQDHPLLIFGLITHAAKNHGNREVILRVRDGGVHHTYYSAAERRARALAQSSSSWAIAMMRRVCAI